VSTAAANGRPRSTRQAAAVEAALAASTGFRSAQELHAALRASGDNTGLTTVYRHLRALVDAGSVDVVHDSAGEARYRACGPARSGVDAGHHHHLVCRVCGESVELDDAAMEDSLSAAASAAGFTELSHTVEVFGRCPAHGPA